MSVRVRFGDRYIERPLGALIREALFAPLAALLAWERGWWAR